MYEIIVLFGCCYSTLKQKKLYASSPLDIIKMVKSMDKKKFKF